MFRGNCQTPSGRKKKLAPLKTAQDEEEWEENGGKHLFLFGHPWQRAAVGIFFLKTEFEQVYM